VGLVRSPIGRPKHYGMNIESMPLNILVSAGFRELDEIYKRTKRFEQSGRMPKSRGAKPNWWEAGNSDPLNKR